MGWLWTHGILGSFTLIPLYAVITEHRTSDLWFLPTMVGIPWLLLIAVQIWSHYDFPMFGNSDLLPPNVPSHFRDQQISLKEVPQQRPAMPGFLPIPRYLDKNHCMYCRKLITDRVSNPEADEYGRVNCVMPDTVYYYCSTECFETAARALASRGNIKDPDDIDIREAKSKLRHKISDEIDRLNKERRQQQDRQYEYESELHQRECRLMYAQFGIKD